MCRDWSEVQYWRGSPTDGWVNCRAGPYGIQAAIAAVHAEASSAAATDWTQIVALYDVLVQMGPWPVVELNRAVALAMRDRPEAGLALVDAILARGEDDQLAGFVQEPRRAIRAVREHDPGQVPRAAQALELL